VRQSRREVHPSTSLPRAQRARSRSPTLTHLPASPRLRRTRHSGSLPTQTAGGRAMRGRKPLRRFRPGVWPWLLVTSQRGHTPGRHRRPSRFFFHAHHHPQDPGNHPECAVFGTQKTHSACCPQGGGQKPPPSAARHDRVPLIPAASAPFVCRCRNLAALKTGPTRHPL
jgi:hypothetical protein